MIDITFSVGERRKDWMISIRVEWNRPMDQVNCGTLVKLAESGLK